MYVLIIILTLTAIVWFIFHLRKKHRLKKEEIQPKEGKFFPRDNEINEKFLIAHADRVDWDNVSSRMKPYEFSDEFYIRFKREINLVKLYSSGNMTTEFAHKNAEKIGGYRWYKDGKLHRKDGPAIEKNDGSTGWYLNGLSHREGGLPAFENEGAKHKGSKEWHVNGKRHREGGLPAVIQYREGKIHATAWFENGKYHREGGPAYISDTKEEWYLKGERHNPQGPSVVFIGREEKFYHIHGHPYSEKEIYERIKQQMYRQIAQSL